MTDNDCMWALGSTLYVYYKCIYMHLTQQVTKYKSKYRTISFFNYHQPDFPSRQSIIQKSLCKGAYYCLKIFTSYPFIAFSLSKFLRFI